MKKIKTKYLLSRLFIDLYEQAVMVGAFTMFLVVAVLHPLLTFIAMMIVGVISLYSNNKKFNIETKEYTKISEDDIKEMKDFLNQALQMRESVQSIWDKDEAQRNGEK